MRIPCESCKLACGCSTRAEFKAQWVLSLFGHGMMLECQFYEPRWCRGLEGVAA